MKIALILICFFRGVGTQDTRDTLEENDEEEEGMRRPEKNDNPHVQGSNENTDFNTNVAVVPSKFEIQCGE